MQLFEVEGLVLIPITPGVPQPDAGRAAVTPGIRPRPQGPGCDLAPAAVRREGMVAGGLVHGLFEGPHRRGGDGRRRWSWSSLCCPTRGLWRGWL